MGIKKKIIESKMLENKNLYSELGVSSRKEDVHNAIKNIDKGLYPGAFCKIVEDIAGRDDYCSVFHADGAGTKSSLAYMYYKETDDISVFRGIAKDAIIMNIDDILCVGASENIYLSNTIGRNNKIITKEIISEIVNEYNNFCKKLSSFGLKLVFCGGETADVGDLVKTLIVDASVFTTMKKKDVIDNYNISPGDVILGLASFGQATYEDEYNSGIGCNGLTLARHGMLSNEYYKKYPECYDLSLKKAFFGKHLMTEKISEIKLTVGKALLSPTRTFTPIILETLKKHRALIHGITHNTSGAHYKTSQFGKNIKFIKDNLFKTPKIFELIQDSSKTDWKEMYQVFNMGDRMEIFCDNIVAKDIINIAKRYNVEAKIIGYCERSSENKNIVELYTDYDEKPFIYTSS